MSGIVGRPADEGIGADASISLSIAGAVVSRMAIYLYLIVAARFLDPNEFGLFSVLLAVINITGALVTGGGDMWLNRFTWRTATAKQQAPRIWASYLKMASGIAVLTFALGLLLGFAFSFVSSYGLALALSLFCAAIAGLTESMLAVLRAAGFVRLFFLVRDVFAPLLLPLLTLVVHPYTATGALLVYAGSWGVLAVLVGARMFWRAPTYLPAVRAPAQIWRSLARHTGALTYGNLSSRISLYLDVLVLTWIIPIAEVGAYRVAAQFAIGFMVVQHFVFLGLPWQLRYTGTMDRTANSYNRVVNRQRLLVRIALPTIILLWLAAELILGFLGPRFVELAYVFRLLLIVRFADLFWGPQHEVLVSSGLTLLDANANQIGIGVWLATFFSSALLIPPIEAAIAANLAASFASQGFRYVMLRRHGVIGTFGHPGGLFVPILIYGATAMMLIW